MRILIVEPGARPREADIPHTLEAMQEVVGGLICATYPWEDHVALVADDEGLMKDYPLNRSLDNGEVIAGTFFICGLDGSNFTDLPDDMMEKYRKMFWYAEKFCVLEFEDGKKICLNFYIDGDDAS